MRPYRVAVMPYFDVPNGDEPELDFGYTEEQLAHSIRIIAGVSHLPLSKIPHSAAQDAGLFQEAKLMCRSARMSQSTAPRHTGTLVL
jgi:hypothetical protein